MSTSIPISTVLVLLAAHFVADFIFQSDWMAVNKSKRWDALAWHVAVYTVVLMVLTGPPWNGVTEAAFWAFIAVNGLAHFVQDAITSRINARFWFFRREDGIWEQAAFTMPKHGRTIVNPWTPIGGKRHWFFVGIGADQLLHYVTLFVTASWWL